MKAAAASFLSLVAVVALCVPTDARRGGGGMRGGGMRGGGMRSSGMSRPTTSRPSGGYNFGSKDFARPSQPIAGGGNRGNLGNGNLGNGNLGGNRGNGNLGGNRGNGNLGGNRGKGDRGWVQNPIYNGPNYGWNGGVVWAPVPYYWGGGFWGPWAWGVTSVYVYGEIHDEEDNVTYNSYQVQPGTPGETFLKSYQLVQVPCGPPDLVVVYGPEQSVICATPNQYVGVGEYQLDTTTLSLISMNPPSPTPSPVPTSAGGHALVTPAPAPTKAAI
jgi:hypothetical protein